MHAKKSLGRHEGTAGGTTDGSGKGADRKEESLRGSLYRLRNYINNHQQTVRRNMGFNSHSGEVSHGNEEHAIETWKKKSHVIKWQTTWLTRVLGFCGNYDLQAIKLGI